MTLCRASVLARPWEVVSAIENNDKLLLRGSMLSEEDAEELALTNTAEGPK